MKSTPRGLKSFQELEVGKIAAKFPFLHETKAAFASEVNKSSLLLLLFI